MTDLRLLPVVLALWIGSAAGLHTGLVPALGIGVGVVAALVSLLRRADLRLWALALVLGALLAALRVDAASPDAVRDFVGTGSASLTLEATIDAEGRPVAASAAGGLQVVERMRAPITITRLDDGDTAWHTSIPATLEWAGSAPIPVGSGVRARALIRSDDVAARSAFRARALGTVRVVRAPARGTGIANAARHGLGRVVGDRGDGAALLPGLVLGDTSAQSPRLVDDLRDAGLSHLTAVSGANVAIVVGALAWLLGRTRVRARHRAALLLATVVAFTVVVQPQPSVMRAAVMAGIGIVAAATGRARASAAVLWLSVVLLLIADPFLAWQYGFALSVAATAGLIVLRPWLLPWMPKGWLGEALVLTVSAQLATAPILVAMGRPPTLASVPANLLCEPLVAPATVLGFLAALLALLALLPLPLLPGILGGLAHVVAMPAIWIAAAIARVAAIAAGSGLAAAPVRTPLAMVLVAAATLALLRLGVRPRHLAILVVAYAILAACMPAPLHGWPPTDWWYAMCDVGQGDATVVRLSTGGALVIDAGPDARAVRACLRTLGVRHVEALFITHFHADHVEGVAGVVAQASVARVFTTPVHAPSIEWRRSTAALPVAPVDVQAGAVLDFGDTQVRVLWPVPGAVDGTPNNGSLVLDINRSGTHLLVTGDVDPAAQAQVVPWLTPADILKVPHHASAYQDAAFLQAAAPTVALVSVGEGNPYGHPAAGTIDMLRARGVRVWRTDRDGALTVSVRDGHLIVTALSG